MQSTALFFGYANQQSQMNDEQTGYDKKAAREKYFIGLQLSL